MSSARADELIQQFVDSGDEPDPDLLDQIIALGDEAVDPLRDLLHRLPENYEEKLMLVNAACLLACLNASSALPDIVALHRIVDFENFDLPSATSHFGPDALDLLLPIIEDKSAAIESRDNAIVSARWATAGDAQAGGRLAETLRRGLAQMIEESSETAPDLERQELGNAFALGLIEMGDVDSLELLEEAWDRNVFERILYAREAIGGQLQKPLDDKWEIEDWLAECREEFAVGDELDDLASEIYDDIDDRIVLAPGEMIWSADEGTYRRDTPKVGRNDPCWCGSGKKYKKCHLSSDESAAIR